MATERKQDENPSTPSNPSTLVQEDRYTEEEGQELGNTANRKIDGTRLANNVERDQASPRSDTAQASPEVNSFDTDRSQDGGHRAGAI